MLDHVALGILIFAAITLFRGIMVIHDIPNQMAAQRNHRRLDAIYSDHPYYVAIVRTITLRMSARMNYLFPFHQAC